MKKILLLMCLLIAQSSMASADIADPDIFRRPSISRTEQDPSLDISKTGDDLEIELRFGAASDYKCSVTNFETGSIVREFGGRYEKRGRLVEIVRYDSPAEDETLRLIVNAQIKTSKKTTNISRIVLIERIDGEDHVFVEAKR